MCKKYCCMALTILNWLILEQTYSDSIVKILAVRINIHYFLKLITLFEIECLNYWKVYQNISSVLFEPAHEIMALFILRKLILQTRMRSHPVELNVWVLVWLFVYFHTSCVQTAKALVRLHGCAGSPVPSLVAYVICTIITSAQFYLCLPACMDIIQQRAVFPEHILSVYPSVYVEEGFGVGENLTMVCDAFHCVDIINFF